MEIFATMLQRCLPLSAGRQNTLSRHIAALRARFRLLHLGLSMLQGNFLTNSVMKNVLRERIYSNALDYFRYVYVFSMLCNLACGRKWFDSVVGDVFFSLTPAQSQ